MFLYQLVLERPLAQLKGLKRVYRRKRLPIVLSPTDNASLLGRMEGMSELVVRLIYGAGLRVNVCCTLRAKDADFASGVIHVRSTKGSKARTVPMGLRFREFLKLPFGSSQAVAAVVKDCWIFCDVWTYPA